jgi:heterodisulfide reductase subunit B
MPRRKDYALFIGCQIPARVKQYEIASRAVLNRLGVALEDFRQFNCCGYPMRNADRKAFLLSAAKNIALAEKAHLDILSLCKCCFGTLKSADFLLKEREDLRAEVNRHLADHGLEYRGAARIRHLLSVLYEDVGIEAIRAALVRRYEKLPIAAHYGCHALRPSRITEFDNPVAPRLFDDLVAATGAESIEWQARLDCCGAPLIGVNDALSTDLTRKKISDARKAGAAFICSACPYCQLRFDTMQESAPPSILYPQLLGLCMGIDPNGLGLHLNRPEVSGIQNFLQKGAEGGTI